MTQSALYMNNKQIVSTLKEDNAVAFYWSTLFLVNTKSSKSILEIGLNKTGYIFPLISSRYADSTDSFDAFSLLPSILIDYHTSYIL